MTDGKHFAEEMVNAALWANFMKMTEGESELSRITRLLGEGSVNDMRRLGIFKISTRAGIVIYDADAARRFAEFA